MRRIARLKETVSPIVAVVSLVYDDGHRETVPREDAFLAAVRSAEDSHRVFRRRYLYLYRPEDLDNSDLIAMVDSMPTYKRTNGDLTMLKRRSSEDATKAEAEAKEKTQAESSMMPEDGTVISFDIP